MYELHQSEGVNKRENGEVTGMQDLKQEVKGILRMAGKKSRKEEQETAARPAQARTQPRQVR